MTEEKAVSAVPVSRPSGDGCGHRAEAVAPDPLTLGWAYAYACRLADKGIDIRTVEVPAMLDEAKRALGAATPSTAVEALREVLPFVEGYAESADDDDPVHEMLPRWKAVAKEARS